MWGRFIRVPVFEPGRDPRLRRALQEYVEAMLRRAETPGPAAAANTTLATPETAPILFQLPRDMQPFVHPSATATVRRMVPSTAIPTAPNEPLPPGYPLHGDQVDVALRELFQVQVPRGLFRATESIADQYARWWRYLRGSPRPRRHP